MIIVTSLIFNSNVYATFFKEDFQIVKFGLSDGNAFIQVQGQAGRSFPTLSECGDECHYAYTLVTDKGIFSIKVANNGFDKPSYVPSHIKIQKFIEGVCITEKISSDKTKFNGSLAEYIPTNVTFKQVYSAHTYKVSEDDPTTNCPSGNHIVNLFSSK